MSKSYLSITIGEEPVNLKFNMGAYDVINELSGIESLSDKGTKDLSVLIYAGMVGNCLAKDKDPDFSYEDVKRKIKKLDRDEMEELGEVVGPFVTEVYGPKKKVSGEGNQDTQPQQTLNVA